MARSYGHYLNKAALEKQSLDRAIQLRIATKRRRDLSDAERNKTIQQYDKEILLHRGRYINNLKRAYKLNNSLMLPKSMVGGTPVAIKDEIRNQLIQHQMEINNAIRQNTSRINNNASVKNIVIAGKDYLLKIKRLATRGDQYRFASSKTARDNLRKSLGKDLVSSLGSTAKPPVMAVFKVMSKLGPLAITLTALPYTAFASLAIGFYRMSENQNANFFNNEVIDLNKNLNNAVEGFFNRAYNTVGRM